MIPIVIAIVSLICLAVLVTWLWRSDTNINRCQNCGSWVVCPDDTVTSCPNCRGGMT